MAVTSPDTFNSLHRYVSVRLQQGVPIVDADVNEREDIRKFELRAFLKWFVGDGVPEGNDGFRIQGAGLASDFIIRAGIAGVPDGLRNVGRCLVDGLDVMITADVNFTAQPLHASQAGSAALATALSVPQIPNLTTPVADGTGVAYLDVWERLVTPSEDPSLVLSGLGTESCTRLKREWVIRVRNGTSVPVSGDVDYLAGHSYYALATLTRRTGDPNVNLTDVTDQRERQLLLPPATLITDLLGVTPADYRHGRGRPAISLREAINALLHDDLPSTSDAPIAPDPAMDFMSYAFNFTPDGSVIAAWHSARVTPNQVFATRWDPANPAAGFATPPHQVTTGAQAHVLPHLVVLPTGEVIVVYETAAADIYFKHAPLLGLNAAAELPVAVTGGVAERHPFAVLAGSQIVFFYHQGTPNPRWMYRRRQYTSTWLEAGATWLDAVGQELSPTNAAPPALTRGDFHAAVDSAGDIWIAFRTETNDIQALCLTSGGVLTNQATLSTANTDQVPFVTIDGNSMVWVFWQAGPASPPGPVNGINYQRFIKATSSWEAAPTLVPDTTSGANNLRPCAVRESDGGIWLFWASDRAIMPPNNDIWFTRRNPTTGVWGQARMISVSPLDDIHPFATFAPNGVLWLFWRSNRAGIGNYDIYFKQIVTAL